MNFIINDIKKNISINEALEEYTSANLSKAPLHKRKFNICCPFHNDRNPSFTVYTDSNRWKCWAGCGHGDVIDLVVKSHNISTKQSIELLGRDLGIQSSSIPWSKVFEHYEQKRKIKQTLNEFNTHCNNCAEQLMALDRHVLEVASNITTPDELEQEGDIYHLSSYIQYLFGLLESNSIENKIFAIKQLGVMTENELFTTE